MTNILLCLSIMPLQSPPVAAPSPVLEIVEQHVLSELRKVSPNLMVNFGVASCPNVIHFEQGVSSIRLFGSAPMWSGENHIAYTDALAGRPINFEPNLAEPAILTKVPAFATGEVGRQYKWKPWVVWGGMALVAGSAIYYFRSRGDNHSKINSGSSGLQTGIKF